jgi:hypothetical protein
MSRNHSSSRLSKPTGPSAAGRILIVDSCMQTLIEGLQLGYFLFHQYYERHPVKASSLRYSVTSAEENPPLKQQNNVHSQHKILQQMELGLKSCSDICEALMKFMNIKPGSLQFRLHSLRIQRSLLAEVTNRTTKRKWELPVFRSALQFRHLPKPNLRCNWRTSPSSHTKKQNKLRGL